MLFVRMLVAVRFPATRSVAAKVSAVNTFARISLPVIWAATILLPLMFVTNNELPLIWLPLICGELIDSVTESLLLTITTSGYILISSVPFTSTARTD